MKDVLLVLSFTTVAFLLLLFVGPLGLGGLVLVSIIAFPLLFPTSSGPPAHGPRGSHD